ncbi:MAG: ABC transporter substrate-binding protein [Sphingomonadales bacterium]
MKLKGLFSRRFLIPLGILLLVAVDPIRAEASTASEVVEEFHAALIHVMKAAETMPFAERRSHLEPFVTEKFDSTFMTRVASGSYWREFSDDQKLELTGAFREMTLANYASRFHGYSGQKFETLSEKEVRGGRLFVRTRLLKSDGDVVRIDYLMREKEDGWKIIDIFLDGKFSELALRRSEFSPIVRDKGYEGLLGVIKTRVADLEAGKDVD